MVGLVPLPNHNNEGDAYAFLDIMFSKFGVPTNVLTDQSTKFQGNF